MNLYPRTYKDIEDIYEYIALEKLSPDNALGQTERIWDALESLALLPESHQDRLEGRYANQGYKQLIVDNYIIIYKINKKSKKVSVLTIQYQGKNI